MGSLRVRAMVTEQQDYEVWSLCARIVCFLRAYLGSIHNSIRFRLRCQR